MNNIKYSITTVIALFYLVLPAHAEQSKQMPLWELPTATGEIISSQSLLGSPVILHFWATWCPYCKKLQPGLDKLYKKYQKDGLKLLAISFNEDEGATPQAVIDKRGHSFKTLINGDNVAFSQFGVQGTPTTFFIYPNGNILGMTRTSDPDDPGLEKAVQMLLENSEKME